MRTKIILLIGCLGAVGLMMGASVPARAATLLDLIDPPGQSDTPYSLTLTATTSSTTVSFGGYQPDASEYVTQIGLFLGGAGPNLLGGTWTFTPSPVPGSSDAFPFSDGTSVPALEFAGLVAGSYDTFSQTIPTIAGDSYTLNFLFTNFEVVSGFNPTSGLLVTTTGAVSTVPLPAALPLFASGLVGLVLLGWRRKRNTAA
jgi:hypothetical protein